MVIYLFLSFYAIMTDKNGISSIQDSFRAGLQD